MADLINAVALLVVVVGVVFYSTLDKLTAGNLLKVLAVAAAIRLAVAVFRQDWVQIVLDSVLIVVVSVLWVRAVRRAKNEAA